MPDRLVGGSGGLHEVSDGLDKGSRAAPKPSHNPKFYQPQKRWDSKGKALRLNAFRFESQRFSR